MALELQIQKRAGAFRLDISLDAGGIVGFLGASGSGKSMTLRAVAGLTRPDSGEITLDGRTLFSSARRINLPPQARRAALLPQDYALFPHMTLLQNLRAGARRERTQAEIPALLGRFRLSDCAEQYPAELSGGQRQRAALARCLLSKPEILLLDEPFSALDTPLRAALEQELRQVLRAFGRTALLVSHDAGELYRLCDTIAVLDRGRIAEFGPREAVFSAPKTRASARLTGWQNISRARRLDSGHVQALDWGLTLEAAGEGDYIAIGALRPGPGIRFAVLDAAPSPGSVRVLLRPMGQEQAAPLIWEPAQQVWNACRAPELTLVPEQILLLKE